MYSYLLVQFFCICQNVTCSMILLTSALKQFGGITRHNAAAHVLAYTVHMALHIYVSVCLSFLRLRSGCLNEDAAFLYSTCNSVCWYTLFSLFKNLLSAILCKKKKKIRKKGGGREHYGKQYYKGGRAAISYSWKKKKLYKKQVYQWWLLMGGLRQGNTVKMIIPMSLCKKNIS